MVEFIEEGHRYEVDGIAVPSVTQIVNWKVKDEYERIPAEILKAKARYGTEVHALIEAYENGMTEDELHFLPIDPKQKSAVKAYIKFKTDHFSVKDMEGIVFNDKCAGRFDILTMNDEIIDIKTTYALNVTKLQWQIGLYYYLMGIVKDYGFVIWLPKQAEPVFKKIRVKSHRQCEKVINEFLDSNI